MSRYEIVKLIEIIDNLKDAHLIIEDYLASGYIQPAQQLISVCQSTAIEAGTAYEQGGGSSEVISALEDYCELLYENSVLLGEIGNKKDWKLQSISCLPDDKLFFIKNKLINEQNARIEVLFLPYKYSMWDSMESIWEAAKQDPLCSPHVVPIPYYDRKPDHTFGLKHYERNLFPFETEAYTNYDLEKEMPDIIYIHNPYDDINLVTTVSPEYYTRELVKHTPMLVYVPYYLMGYKLTHQEFSTYCKSPGCQLADKIVLQSENLRTSYIENGISPEKLAVLGSPKIDAVLKHLQGNPIPDEWKRKIKGKKVILFNNSISSYLSAYNWLSLIKKILLMLSNYKDLVVIWRPHPLFVTTILSMKEKDAKEYLEMIDMAEHSDHIIRDVSSDIYAAFEVSDGMISDNSSLVQDGRNCNQNG